MLGKLTAIAGAEAGRMVRRGARRAALLGIALVFAGTAVVFLEVALFLWLVTVIAPPLAGAAVAGLSLLVALVFLLLATRRSARARRLEMPEEPLSAPARRIASQAEAVGAMLGRDLGGYPLVFTALVVGILLGRRRR